MTNSLFPFPLLVSPPLPSSPLSSPLFRSRPLKCSWKVWGSAVSSPSGKPQPTSDWCILESKSAALVAAVFVETKKKIVAGSNSSQGGAL